MTIIDVSEWQGVIDWNKARPHIDGVILRCGCGTSYDDKQWARNVRECERLGIPFGVYLYSYAKDTTAAKKEAEHVLRMIKGHRLSYPVYFDAEQGGTEKVCNQTAKTFCDTLEAAGYYVGIYSTAYWFAHYLKDDGRYTRWVASWGTNNGQPQVKPNVKSMAMWQYTSVGKIPGVNGNVDVSLCYEDFPSIINPTKPETTPIQPDTPAEREDEMQRFNTVAELPEAYRADVQTLIDKGLLRGKGDTAHLDLTEDMARVLIVCGRMEGVLE